MSPAYADRAVPSSAPPIATATYRIQLTPDLGFDAAIGLLDHVGSLGISHLYLSPVAEAVPGSTHGYDVVDHRLIRAEFGGETGLWALLDAAQERNLGVIIDHVPNHCSAAQAHLNPHWWALLRDGAASDAAAWFDVEWAAADDKVIVPKLGSPLADVLAVGDLTMARGDLGPELRYGPLRFPLAPGTEHLDVADAVSRQHYRLSWWRDPARNVRRFFTIDDLVAIRVENESVADVVDTIPARLTEHGAFAGVRVDHVDGLADPGAYLARLRRVIGDRWLLVEKILAEGEACPPSWPVAGTTGYEHIRAVEHMMLDATSEPALTDLWTSLTGDDRPFAAIEDEARREVLAEGLRPDLDRFVRTVAAAPPATDATTDADRVSAAVRELTIGLHRYRTYLPDDEASSLGALHDAHARALRSRPELEPDLAVLADLVQLDPAVRTRWPQLSSPVMAKGAEDRAFYRYHRLASLCEVGGSPGRFGTTVEEFHRYQATTQALAPSALLAGTTHDTKRSEGVRARSLVLTEMADEWATFVRVWFTDHRSFLNRDGLDAGTVLLALQTVVTSAPIDAERLTEYLVKSSREADRHTSWTAPAERYERALADLAGLLVTEADGGTDHSLANFVDRVASPGRSNSLSALALRLTSPGVPDIYQGSTDFLYTLVDPDNRVEPDWDERREVSAEAADIDAPTAWERPGLHAEKAVVIQRVLDLRRRRPDAFGLEAGYAPITATGPAADHVVAFARTGHDRSPAVATLVVRHPHTVSSWTATTVDLPPGRWNNVLADDDPPMSGGEPAELARWFDQFPVAVLERTADP